ncbi:MAG: OmpH family outer membrane protein [Candidatus Riflebacteria bacterium]|nr:OmpH family outer membrane protein [Candidatus Riflebacteria bacterium]
MKVFKLIFFLFFMFLITQSVWAINANEVATIDLSMALCLHPKMSLFDFNRIGFYKVEFGLTEEEFNAKTEVLRASAPDRSDELNKIQKELDDVYNERSSFSDYYVNADEKKLKTLEQLMQNSLLKEKELNEKILDINHQTENFDLTSPKETLAIIEEIEKDIFEAINQVAEEENYSVVLNTTIPVPYTFEKNYINSEIYGQGIPGINFMLFYSFLSMNNLDSPIDEVPPSRDLINWLELTRYPKTVNLLPMKPYPLVLSGGKSILSSVMKKVYNKYNIKPAVYNVVDSVIIKIEQLQNGKKVDKKTVKYDF